MSAYVTYNITAEDGKGKVIATFPVRTPFTLSTGQCVNLARQAGYAKTTFASARRSSTPKLGRASTTRVSSTVRFL